MGNYITEATLEARVGEQLLSRFVQQPSGSANYSAEVANVIERAEGRVDAYLSELYAVPVTATAFLEALTLDVAEWELYRRATGSVPEKVRQAYEDALEDLQRVADGKMGTGAATVPASSDSTGGFDTDGATGLFDPESMDDADW